MTDMNQLLFKANLCERSERFEEMVLIVQEMIKACYENKLEITVKIRNFFSVAYKNTSGTKRASWRTLNMEKEKYKDQEIEKYNTIMQFLMEIENELNEICDDVIGYIDKYILSKEDIKNDIESQVFFYKMKGDYFRYKAEVTTGQNFEHCKNESKNSYEKASEASSTLPSVHSLKLGLSLNFSVFYYEIEKSPQKACFLAKQAFDDAIKDIDDLSEDHYKDSTLIMQLLRDNLSLWTHRDDVSKDNEDKDE